MPCPSIGPNNFGHDKNFLDQKLKISNEKVFGPVQNILVLVQICFRRTKNNICALIKNFWFSGSFFYVKSQLNLYQNHIHLFNKLNYKKYFNQWHFLILLIFDALYFPKYAQFLTTPWINLIQDMKKSYISFLDQWSKFHLHQFECPT